MKAAKRLSKDRISSLPSTIIETILCLVPIRDAVRTSILSRNWRYKWVRIPKLLFDEKDMFDKSNGENQLVQPRNGRKQLTDKCKVFYAIYQVLLLHQGPILEFTLSMKADKTCVEIDQIILHLSMKNTLKKLTLHSTGTEYYLRSSFFSLQQLTDLSLDYCKLGLNPTSSRIGSLTSLSLMDVEINRETFLHLISSSPLLKCFSVMLWDAEIHGETLRFDIIELFKFLPVIEYLSIWGWIFREYSAQDVVPRELPTKLVHLKSLYMFEMLFVYKFQIFALFILIRSSPNLEKIKLEQKFDKITDLHKDSEINSLDDYSDIWLENLHELEIENFFNLKLELEFVKLILSKSPVLKKVRIRLSEVVKNDEELTMLRTIIHCRRASPFAEITVERP